MRTFKHFQLIDNLICYNSFVGFFTLYSSHFCFLFYFTALMKSSKEREEPPSLCLRKKPISTLPKEPAGPYGVLCPCWRGSAPHIQGCPAASCPSLGRWASPAVPTHPCTRIPLHEQHLLPGFTLPITNTSDAEPPPLPPARHPKHCLGKGLLSLHGSGTACGAGTRHPHGTTACQRATVERPIASCGKVQRFLAG